MSMKTIKLEDLDAMELATIVLQHIGCLNDKIEDLGEGAGEYGYDFSRDEARKIYKMLIEQIYPPLRK